MLGADIEQLLKIAMSVGGGVSWLLLYYLCARMLAIIEKVLLNEEDDKAAE